MRLMIRVTKLASAKHTRRRMAKLVHAKPETECFFHPFTLPVETDSKSNRDNVATLTSEGGTLQWAQAS